MILSSHFFQAADDKKIRTVIMLDFNEAFDSINHVVLMQKLKRTLLLFTLLFPELEVFGRSKDDARSIAWHYSWPVVV